ncbi:hypothetical protein [Silvanigrella aquatica]|uniref:Uncharacterized protein n=1 Tax=Silvanigrella aquatica TaxID=1915309 RepID=A0A1L4D2I0_9BACT|nr:hypothetical protein [Silvanigrella aquatica]APJ04404.1 hypothetical protein AXG55_10995 [Silvanigrella aquatica]
MLKKILTLTFLMISTHSLASANMIHKVQNDSYDALGKVRQSLKGCFNSWFKELHVSDKIYLMEYLKPDGNCLFNPEEILNLSNSLNNFTLNNLNSCQNDNILGNITTLYITIELEQYLTDKTSNRTFNEKYNSILELTYNNLYKFYSSQTNTEFINSQNTF